MADKKASGIHNMTGATTLSNEIGQLIQLRKGCFDKPNSGAKFDRCGKCYGGTTNKTATVRDCFGGCDTAKKDSCGVCQKKGAKYDENKFKDRSGQCKNKAHHAAGHILAMAWVAFHKHGSRLED